MRNPIRIAVVVPFALLWAIPAAAWGPKTDVAVVTTATHVISQEGTIDLTGLAKYTMSGASVSSTMMGALYPRLKEGPIKAIEMEMYLLRAVRGNKVDPYFAFRLGVLGKLVAQVTSPLAEAGPTYRNLYYADVDKYIQRASLKTSPRRVVEPMLYFDRLRSVVKDREALVLREYQEGLGFSDLVKGAVSEDASRTVDAIVDVWTTILTSTTVMANISEEQTRDYILKALEFYVERGYIPQVDATYQRLRTLGLQDPRLREEVADLFYNAGEYERALREYEAVLALEPNRKDVREKIAQYHLSLGDAALAEDGLNAARDAYQAALEADTLNTDAQQKLLEAERLIDERDKRLLESQEAVQAGNDIEAEADREAARGNYAKALELAKNAEIQYLDVSDEFPEEYREANIGIRNIAHRIQEFKGALIQDAQLLSGTGFTTGVADLAQAGSVDLSRQALRTLVRDLYVNEVQKLSSELRRELEPQTE